MIVVLDANVIISGLISYGEPTTSPAHLLHRWINRKFSLHLSVPLLSEVIRTLESPYFRDRILLDRRTEFIALLRRESTFVSLTAQVSGRATHPEDDLILATVVSANAEYLVTGDRQLLKLGEYEGVKIVSPADFLALLDQAADPA